MITRRGLLAGGSAALGMGLPISARAQNKPIKIGILEDMSGTFSDLGGSGTLAAAKMAVEDFGGKVLDRPIEVLSGDHQNKADLAASIARKWYDVDGVDLITGLTNSAVALAVHKLTADKNRVDIVLNAATDLLIEDSCSPNGIMWNWTARTIVQTTVAQSLKNGSGSWFFIASDYAGGKIMEDQAAPLIQAAGEKLVGAVRPPLGAADFASFLLAAQSSGAKTLGVMTFGQDFISLMKQAVEFGLPQTMKLVAPFVYHTDLRAIGPAGIQGMPVAAPFYWDLNPETRAWSERFRKIIGHPPDVGHAGAYTAVTHYLKAIKSAGSSEAGPTLAAMRKLPVDDMNTKGGFIRADGMVVRQIYLFVGKTPAESKDPWDLLRQTGTVEKEAAFTLPNPPKCALLKS